MNDDEETVRRLSAPSADKWEPTLGAVAEHCFGDSCQGSGYCTCGCVPCAKAPRQDYSQPNRGSRLAASIHKKAKPARATKGRK